MVESSSAGGRPADDAAEQKRLAIENLYPVLIQCFAVILAGIISEKIEIKEVRLSEIAAHFKL